MLDQTLRKVEALSVSGIAIIGYSHGRFLLGAIHGIRRKKKNLTEINHKVSVSDKRRKGERRWIRTEMRQLRDQVDQRKEAVMLDAQVGSWAREFQITAGMLESVRGLNHRFLDLVAVQSDDWNSSRRGLPGEVCARIAPLSAGQKAAAASCPYALFDLRFNDDRHWQARLRTPDDWRVADEARVDPSTLDFAGLALFFAWHVAASTKLAAQLLLGMNEVTAMGLRLVPIDCLPSLAAAEAVNLTARWNYCGTYWNALAGAASRPNPGTLRRIQLYGLQLTAAAHLG